MSRTNGPLADAGAKPRLVGLIGAGRMGRAHMAAWGQLGASVIVFAHEGAAELAGRHGVRTASSMEQLLSRVDFVDIVTPSDTHAEFAVTAIEAGHDVVCEKPLALSTSSALAVQTAAELYGRTVFPAHVVRFTKPNIAAHRAIQKGRIGQVAVARFHRSTAAPFPGSWLSDDARSGGIVFDLMIHDLDQARWMCGAVDSVYAVRSRPVPGDASGICTVHATLTHASGAISQVTATWGPIGTQFFSSFSIAGDLGVIRHDSRQISELSIDIPDAGGSPRLVRRALAAAQHNPYLSELEAFLQLRPTLDPRVTCEDGVEAVRLAEAVSRAISSGVVTQLHDASQAEMAVR
ncbi:Gfo/Idh/MocA family protein [Mycetocola miduiensis]|uniref:Myo-inositol 2-dehydrogenase / D-chiro-inositol 1-dehydrogenase n=1 Tax=Mycetocola miduiensis TaxID=995034 RepID=A0A1I4YPI5_9MICO|nr:Gfo/Idh/MocA family oxidoreductase [Mycetocola miduiensis]SFN39922.1 myo-inositol 2-dehydrogenase / D-chiro-inositol 1-dehydrogenase [Mycetocola miduiensis]